MPNPSITASVSSSISTTPQSLFALFTAEPCHAKDIANYESAIIENTGDGTLLVSCVSPDIVPTAADAIAIASANVLALDFVNTKQCYVWIPEALVGAAFTFNAMPASLNDKGTLS